MTENHDVDAPKITELSKAQRRVLGVLLEKAFTTPEYYPLTLKAVTTGCNQKSNRMPVVNYSEDDVADVLEQLREMGLVAVLHTESGRTERYRHYMRRRFTLTEPQLAILTELLLRGRQQLGELRTRASRMAPIESQDQLREELRGLQELNLIQSNAPLERRGAEVDHNWYRPQEGQTMRPMSDDDSSAEPAASSIAPASTRPAGASAAASPTSALQSQDLAERFASLEQTNEQLLLRNRDLESEIEAIKDELRRINDRVEELRRDLGG